MKKLLFFVLITFVSAQSNEKILTLNEPLEGITSMKVNVDFGMGEFLLEKGQEKFAVTGYLQYNRKYTDSVFEYAHYGSTGILDIETDFDLSWSDSGKKNDDKSNSCEVYLSPEVPIKMSIDFGFGDGNFNLNDLQVSEFLMDCGLGEATVDFGENKNPAACKRVDIDNGLGSVNVSHLANANTQKMEFECGLGSMGLDFAGEINMDIDVDISVGMGSISILVPRNTNVIFEYDGSFLSSIDLDDFDEIEDQEFRSEVYTEGNPTIFFSVSVGAGSVRLSWID
ncbi:MAG: hypothetical protein H8D46_01215 [FCB group bacterium]|nr:hypothetical protein [FCB group bacterium]